MKQSKNISVFLWVFLIIAALVAFSYILSQKPLTLFSKKSFQAENQEIHTEPIMDKVQVVVFYPELEGWSLIAQKTWINKFTDQTEIARELIKELAQNRTDTHFRYLPQGTRLKNWFLTEDGIAFADFTRELTTYKGGSLSEYITVYSIVNTLAYNLKGIMKVMILVEGQELSTFSGHIDISEPLIAVFSLVKEM